MIHRGNFEAREHDGLGRQGRVRASADAIEVSSLKK
jgi:hypothetical protein